MTGFPAVNPPATAQEGHIVWYRTGAFTASRCRVLEVSGQGATLTYRVRFLDRAPSQPDTIDVNPRIGGGIRVAARKCEPVEAE